MVEPYPVPEAIRQRLAPGEALLWHGQPRQGLMLRPADALLIPFSLLWAGFAFYWEWSVLQTDAPWWFVVWGIPFMLMGLYIVIGRFFIDARQRARTAYALTPERVLIVRSGARGRGEVQSFTLGTLADLKLTERADGSGSIVLGRGSGPWAMWGGWLMPGWPGAGAGLAPQLEAIADAARVERLIRDAQRRALSARPPLA